MLINWSIRTKLAERVAEGQFDESDRAAVRRFAARAKEAWESGHIVTTVQAETA